MTHHQTLLARAKELGIHGASRMTTAALEVAIMPPAPVVARKARVLRRLRMYRDGEWLPFAAGDHVEGEIADALLAKGHAEEVQP